MRIPRLLNATKVLALLVATLTLTGCLFIEWDGHHHHHRYYRSDYHRHYHHYRGSVGIDIETPLHFGVAGGVVLPIAWQGAVDPTIAPGRVTPAVGISNCYCGAACATTCGTACPADHEGYCPMKGLHTPPPAPLLHGS